MQSLYGKIVVGVFLMQDFVAILILLALSSLGQNSFNFYSNFLPWQNIVFILVRALILFLGIIWLSNKVFPKVIGIIGKSEELVLIFSFW